MEPILKRKVGSILEALEAAACSTFNMKELENEIAVILAPTGQVPVRKESISIKEEEPVIVGDFSFVRHKQEYIPGLSIPQEENSFIKREEISGFGVASGAAGLSSPRYHGGRGRRGYERGGSIDRGSRPDHRMRHHRMKTEEEASDSDLPNKKETITTTDDESVHLGEDFSSSRNKQEYNPDRATPFLEMRDRSAERGVSGFRPHGSFSGHSGPRQQGGFSGHGGPRPHGGFSGPRPQGGFSGPRSHGGFSGPSGSRPHGGFAGPSGSNFRPGSSFHSNNNMGKGYDRGRGSDRGGGGGGRRGVRGRRKMSPEEEAANLAKMIARDAEAERRIMEMAGVSPDPK